MQMNLDRREWLGLGAGSLLTVHTATADSPSRKPCLRAAHITDVHITKERESPEGVAKLFQHMFAEKAWNPDLILNSGDTVMAVDGNVTGAKAAEQIALWKKAIQDGCKVPIYSCLGNHDFWDGKEPTKEIPAEKAKFQLMMEVLGMPAQWYSFDKNGWHFIALNSMCNWPKYASLSKDHLDWLHEDLKKTPKDMPVCLFSHVPILSITSLVYGDDCRKGNDNLVPGIWHHADCWAISELFRRHPNVKLCLSGHMHTCDRCEYRGVWYICGGAVSGAWWNGSEYGFPPMYGQIDFFADGTFEYRFTNYGWKNQKWQGKEFKL